MKLMKNRTNLIAPVVAAALATCPVHAATNNFSRGTQSTTRANLQTFNTRSARPDFASARADARDAAADARQNRLADRSARFSDGFDNASSRDRIPLAGLSRIANAQSGDGSADRLPTVTSERETDDGKITRTVNVDGSNGGNLKLVTGVERSGPTLQELAADTDGTRSLDSTLKLTSSVEGSGSRSSGGDNSATGIGRERSSDSEFSNTSALTVQRAGSATQATQDQTGSRNLQQAITSDNTASHKVNRTVAAATDTGEDRSTQRSRETRYGFTSTADSASEGLKVTARSRNFDPNFTSESDSSSEE